MLLLQGKGFQNKAPKRQMPVCCLCDRSFSTVRALSPSPEHHMLPLLLRLQLLFQDVVRHTHDSHDRHLPHD
jgi:hypothetical protein